MAHDLPLIDVTLPDRLHQFRISKERQTQDTRQLLEYLAGDVDRYLQTYDGNFARADQLRELLNLRTRIRMIKEAILK